MERKIKKWSNALKWFLGSVIVVYTIGLMLQLPAYFVADEWSQEIAEEQVLSQFEGYINVEESRVVLDEAAGQRFLQEKRHYLVGRLAEIMLNSIIFALGFMIARRLSKAAVFDKKIGVWTRWIGYTICASSIIVPTLAQKTTMGIILIGGFGNDLLMEWSRLGCGVAVILIAYLLEQSHFLQEEYDTTL